MLCRVFLTVARRLDPIDEDVTLGKAQAFHHVVVA